MTNDTQKEIETLEERAKAYYHTVKSEIESYQKENITLFVGLDPKEKKYWIGETESEVIQKKEKDGNKNIIYFMKLHAKKNNLKNKLCITSL